MYQKNMADEYIHNILLNILKRLIVEYNLEIDNGIYFKSYGYDNWNQIRITDENEIHVEIKFVYAEGKQTNILKFMVMLYSYKEDKYLCDDIIEIESFDTIVFFDLPREIGCDDGYLYCEPMFIYDAERFIEYFKNQLKFQTL